MAREVAGFRWSVFAVKGQDGGDGDEDKDQLVCIIHPRSMAIAGSAVG